MFDVTYAAAADRLGALLEADPRLARARHPVDGRSPLHVLAGRGVPAWRPLFDLLLAHGADPAARDDAGQTPLETARAAEADDVATALSRL